MKQQETLNLKNKYTYRERKDNIEKLKTKRTPKPYNLVVHTKL